MPTSVKREEANSEEISTPVEAIRFSSRAKTQTQYNEDDYDMYGLEPEDDEAATPNSQPAAEEDEGDVVEMILDHRRLHGTGKIYISLSPY